MRTIAYWLLRFVGMSAERATEIVYLRRMRALLAKNERSFARLTSPVARELGERILEQMRANIAALAGGKGTRHG